MDFEAYKRANFVEPQPVARFPNASLRGAVLYFADYGAAVDYYTEVFGDPAYVEGEGTTGWPLGETWLTLLAGGDGAPRNSEMAIVMPTPEDAERLQEAFVEAGGTGSAASDQLMYQRVRACPVTDPFGTEILIWAPLPADR